MRTVDLRAEAIAEAGRLAKARVILREGDQRALTQLEGDTTWIAMARRRGRRRAHERRVYLVWRVTLEDAAGRLVESRLVPVVVEVATVPGTTSRRAWILALLEQTDADIQARVEAASGEWRATTLRMAGAFASARLHREHAIAGQRQKTAESALQPGLFDRRSERSQLTRAAEVEAAELTAAERLRAIDVLVAIAPQPARLLLVLAR